jgi:[ribosomal protein S18]-alanine N-acetyltransferase
VSTTDFQLRKLSYTDLPRVIAIERRCFTMPWSLSMFVLELSKPSGICLAAVSDTRMLGYVICARYEDAYHVMTIAVEPDCRQQGVARGLLDALLDKGGHDANYTLEVRVSNVAAIALYEAYDFRAVGTRPHYYSDNGEDAIIMWRADGNPWEV